MTKRRIPKKAARSIASERIDILFGLVEQEARQGRTARARRYLDLAMRLGMRYKVSISRYKKRFCPECKSIYQFPDNAVIRLKRGRIIITCRNCGHISRYPYKG
jgi:ribonuclease P protein subunit RPR2